MSKDDDSSPSIHTLQLQLSAIEGKLAKAVRREDTGVHRINTASFLVQLEDQLTKRRQHTQKLAVRWVLAAVGVFGTPSAIFGASILMDDSPPPVKSVDVKSTVENQSVVLEDAIGSNAKGVANANTKIRRLGKAIIEVQDQQTVQTQYISDKLDALSSKARAVKPPPAIKRARKRVDDKHKEDRLDELFGGTQ